MAKVAHWFKHDADAINDPKMIEIVMLHGLEGYGVFFGILGILTRQANYTYDLSKINILSRAFFIDENKLSKMMDDFFRLKLFVKKDGKFYSERHVNDMKVIESKKTNGSKGAKVRWGKQNGESNSELHSEPNGEHDGNKKREEKIREDKNREKESLKEKNILQLRESSQMKESVCLLNKIKPEKCNELLEIFITRISGTDEIYRPPTENKRHFLNWVPEYLKNPTMLDRALTQSRPTKIVSGKDE